MSTTFMGRSRPLEDLCRHTPRSADPVGRAHQHDYPSQDPGLRTLVRAPNSMPHWLLAGTGRPCPLQKTHLQLFSMFFSTSVLEVTFGGAQG